MADVHLSPTVQRLVAKYGNQLKEWRGVDPAISAYDLGLHEVTVRQMGLRKCNTVPRKGDRHD